MKQKPLKSWEEEKGDIYHYDVWINFKTQVDDENLRRSYLSKNANKNFKAKEWKRKVIYPYDIKYDGEAEVNNDNMRKMKKFKWNKNLSNKFIRKIYINWRSF